MASLRINQDGKLHFIAAIGMRLEQKPAEAARRPPQNNNKLAAFGTMEEQLQSFVIGAAARRYWMQALDFISLLKRRIQAQVNIVGPARRDAKDKARLHGLALKAFVFHAQRG